MGGGIACQKFLREIFSPLTLFCMYIDVMNKWPITPYFLRDKYALLQRITFEETYD